MKWLFLPVLVFGLICIVHTHLLNDQIQKEHHNNGSVTGVGIFIEDRDFSGINRHDIPQDFPEITSVLPHHGADLAGVRPGDLLLNVNGKDARELLLSNNLQSEISGPIGSKVKLELGRDNKVLIKWAIRGQFIPPAIRVEYIQEKTPLVQVSQFNKNTIINLVTLTKTLIEQGEQNIILDLRHLTGEGLRYIKKILEIYACKGQLIWQTKHVKENSESINKVRIKKVIAQANGIGAPLKIIMWIDKRTSHDGVVLAKYLKSFNQSNIVIGEKKSKQRVNKAFKNQVLIWDPITKNYYDRLSLNPDHIFKGTKKEFLKESLTKIGGLTG